MFWKVIENQTFALIIFKEQITSYILMFSLIKWILKFAWISKYFQFQFAVDELKFKHPMDM